MAGNPIRDIPKEERPYEKCRARGAASLSDAELLAVILRTGTRGQGALDTARRVLELCSGLLGLFHSSADELMAIPGVGEVKAAQLSCIGELAKRISRTAGRRGFAPFYVSGGRSGILYGRNAPQGEGRARVAFLNTRGRLLKEKAIFVGTANSSLISPREIFLEALRVRAVSLILVHNHPSGDPEPSREDLLVTERIRRAGELLDISVADHIIIGDNCFISFKERGIFRMKHNKKKTSSFPARYVLFILMLLCVSLLAVDYFKPGLLKPVTDAVHSVLLPMQKGLNHLGTGFADTAYDYQSLEEAREENKALREEVASLREQVNNYQQGQIELEELRQLFELSGQYTDYEMTGARVIQKDAGNWYHSFVIDKGADDGLQVDMNVIAGGGLVGIITEVGPNYARVRSIIDDDSNVSAMSLNSGDTCIVSGTLDRVFMRRGACAWDISTRTTTSGTTTRSSPRTSATSICQYPDRLRPGYPGGQQQRHKIRLSDPGCGL